MKITEQKKEALKQWVMLELLLIQPIEEIISRLKNKEYDNIDIDNIEKLLGNFVDIASKIFDIRDFISHDPFSVLDSYSSAKYIEYFSMLLIIFKYARDIIMIED
jgi:hypothetical protein